MDEWEKTRINEWKNEGEIAIGLHYRYRYLWRYTSTICSHSSAAYDFHDSIYGHYTDIS